MADVKRSRDPSTLSEPQGPGRARVVHMDLDLTVDFVGQRLAGHVDLHCARNAAADDGVWECVLDCATNLVVHSVSVEGKVLDADKWHRDVSKEDAVLGLPLRVTLPDGPSGEKLVVRVAYETAAPGPNGGGSSALQWLTPAQTMGKVLPYMFSQCQAIHARAMIPCQDTCECKVTYNASVRAPTGLNVLMSALKSGEGVACDEAEWETPEGCGKEWSRHEFKQALPVPAYLVAIVCGALESRRVGPRSQVWSEKEMVDDCAWEFAETEKYIVAGEALCGPYSWGAYDLLVLPPSFPYGGMENPCLTFITPTLLARDRSQVHVVAHEISHSWSGNLVTNETWEHFWLNEGLTVFTEMKILRDVHGPEEAQLQLASRLRDLEESVSEYGHEHNFTRLVPDLSGNLDPDDAFSTVPYIKGMSLFSLLESVVGGEEKFQPFVRAYFAHFAGGVVSSQSMRDYFLEYFQAQAATDPDIAAALTGPVAALDWEKLWSAPGMPDFIPAVDTSPLEEAKALAERWLQAGDDVAQLAAFSPEDVGGWGSSKKTVFLDSLAKSTEDTTLPVAAVERMQDVYDFFSANCELRFRFLRLGLAARWAGAVDPAVAMATSQGRMKYTRPLYRSLKSYDAEIARETFSKHRGGYHPICSKMVASDLGV